MSPATKNRIAGGVGYTSDGITDDGGRGESTSPREEPAEPKPLTDETTGSRNDTIGDYDNTTPPKDGRSKRD